MASFTKADLIYTGYKDSARPGDNPNVTGKPDGNHLNRSESYEMVYFINTYMKTKNWQQKSTFNKIETYLKKSPHVNKSHDFWRKDLDANFRLN
ncbi:MAG: hypothetical protein EOO96_06005 [Pedobacter sp.]|nr:MAG: hypothetical protein EOO96_06005 [Pedobacter sp.]